MKPVAIIGIGCRFPGAPDTKAFWQLLRNGVDAIGEVPEGRWNLDEFLSDDPDTPGTMRSRWGGFIEHVDEFDPHFFGISPREAVYMDPQQRLFLEVAWESLEDAGQQMEALRGQSVGVYLGMASFDYGALQLSDPFSITDGYVNTGSALSIAANRISYLFDFRGPSMVIDTACSSSLVAVHLACRSLAEGESSIAVAGGVNLILSPVATIGFDKLNVMAADGRCKAFDARADGYVRSEGAGAVVLKPLDEAIADGDRVYAVIRGGAVNQDGRTNGLTAPNGPSQEALVREALVDAEVEPAAISYVEAHGTGTALGDPIELNSLGEVLATGRPDDRPCAVGSVKSNCGHLEAAAGIAGLIKVALSLEHLEIPPSLHFQQPNPHIPFDRLPFEVQTSLGSWPKWPGRALAGVSSFGFGGTNAHLVLEEPPAGTAAAEDASPSSHEACLFPLSARSAPALRVLAESYHELLTNSGADTSPPGIEDVCYSAALRRSHLEHRLALVASSTEELAELLQARLEAQPGDGSSFGSRIPGQPRKLVFVFPGQGSQWLGMGRSLMAREPVFRRAIEAFDHAMQAFVDWSVIEELEADEAASRLDEVDVVQPAICAVQIALAALWQSWGIEPKAVVGQSLGEVAASHVAGALSLDDAARVICLRSRLVKRTSGQGAMAVVELALPEAQALVSEAADRVSVAVSNSPTSTVLSGDPGTLTALLEDLERRDVFCRMINVDYASHGPQMDPVCDDLLPLLEPMEPRSSIVPFYSTVAASTGRLDRDARLDASYWARNLREPSLFSLAIQMLIEDRHDVFLEISPHPILLPAVQQGLDAAGRTSTLLPSLRREENERSILLQSLGTLYVSGLPPRWSRVTPPGGRFISLPGYPWQRESFWRQPGGDDDGRRDRAAARPGGRDSESLPLPGRYLRSAAHDGSRYWELELGLERYPYLADHEVEGAVLVPAALYLEWVREAAESVFGTGEHSIRRLSFSRALILPDDGSKTVQLVLSPAAPGDYSFEIFSVDDEADPDHRATTLHVAGLLARVDTRSSEGAGSDELTALRERCASELPAEEHYRRLASRGLQYGPLFQGITEIWQGDGEALARVSMPESESPDDSRYGLHPALIDACFQVLGAALPDERDTADGSTIRVPVSIDQIDFERLPERESEIWAHARANRSAGSSTEALDGDITVRDGDGQALFSIQRLRLDRLAGVASAEHDVENWLYEIAWQAADLPAPAEIPDDAAQGRWILFADRQGVGAQLRGALEDAGGEVVLVSRDEDPNARGEGLRSIRPSSDEAHRELLHDLLPKESSCRGIIHLWSLDSTGGDQTTLASLGESNELGSLDVLALVKALSDSDQPEPPNLWLVTAGVQAVEEADTAAAVGQSPLWGLGRTITHEHPELDCRLLDLGANASRNEITALAREILLGDNENQIVLRGDERRVARVVRRSADAERVGNGETHPASRPAPVETGDFRLETREPGILDNLELRSLAVPDPKAGEVVIRVTAAGLNFADVVQALGLLPPRSDGSVPLGFECAGTLVAVGEGVEGLRPGDEVIAIAPNALASTVTTSASLALPRPEGLDAFEAATIPVAFLTAYYALCHLGRLRSGERVLIHAASGGVGLAAVQLAQSIGAEIFATAGSPEKRQLLASLGVQYTANSRSLDFADRIMEWTAGEGVDMVVNSLSGEAIDRGLALLRPGGRFLELGKTDILANRPLASRLLAGDTSFCAVDLTALYSERRSFLAELFSETIRFFEDHGLKPLPHQVFPLPEAVEAFHTMAQARHVGKIVLSVPERATAVATSTTGGRLASGTCLITGGLGGLGLAVARALAEKGARHLTLVSRSEPSEDALQTVDAIRETGAQVTIAQADVARPEELARVFEQLDRDRLPLEGVIHAAGVLADGVLLHQDRTRFDFVMAPKVRGAWNLHTLTVDRPLDFFVLFSSAASLLGSPGQGNYAAANAFLDALAHYRRGIGLPGLSINWGPWSEVGLATRPDRTRRLELQGLGTISPDRGVEALDRVLFADDAQIAVLPVRPGGWPNLFPGAGDSPLLSEMLAAGPGSEAPPDTAEAGDLRATILEADGEQRRGLLEDHLREQVAQVLRIPPAKLDLQEPLNRLGIDSLMAVELKSRIEGPLRVNIPLIQLIKGPSISQVANLLQVELDADAEGAPAPTAESGAAPASKSMLLSLLSLSEKEEDDSEHEPS